MVLGCSSPSSDPDPDPDMPVPDAAVPVTDAMPPPSHTVTVNLQGPGTVNADGLTCVGSTCSGSFVEGSSVVLTASTQNGTNTHFVHWMDGCASAGTSRTCTLSVTGPATVGAKFGNQTYNIIFTSSKLYPSTLGSAAAYDAKCNELATAAGINTLAGDGFMAWISDASSSAGPRLEVNAAARKGFMRVDGEVVTYNLPQLSLLRVIYYPAMLTELGTPSTARHVWTGTLVDGSATSNNCMGWTDSSTSRFATLGFTGGGPGVWTEAEVLDCARQLPIRCLGKTKDQSFPYLDAIPSDGKIMFLSVDTIGVNGGGAAAMDALCTSEASGTFPSKTFKAFVSRTTVPASDLVDSRYVYYRRESGAAVASGAALRAGAPFLSGVWTRVDWGQVMDPDVRAWTGSAAPNQVATLETSCNDWTSSDAQAIALVGAPIDVGRVWNDQPTPRANLCDKEMHVYCVEQ